LTVWALAFCALAAALHFASIVLAATRCFAGARLVPPPPGSPGVTIVRPLCGADNFVEETLESTFRLDYPEYEINFCLARTDDPVAPLVRRLIAAHPGVPARLLIGVDTTSPNPKLNNVVKGWDEIRGRSCEARSNNPGKEETHAESRCRRCLYADARLCRGDRLAGRGGAAHGRAARRRKADSTRGLPRAGRPLPAGSTLGLRARGPSLLVRPLLSRA
jgi:cellulose synthase/poly-beta-1,6-N-acetylglucosamine synthase-like glycosyltransferase